MAFLTSLTRTRTFLPDGRIDVEFLVNDLSLSGQYTDVQSFQSALARLMKMKRIVRQYGMEFLCHRNLASAPAVQTATLLQAIQGFQKDKKRSIMLWLNRTGPFWDDDRLHGPDDYMVCMDQIVTDTAVGEAAWCGLNGIDRHLASFSPSQWEIPFLSVACLEDEESKKVVTVQNFWEAEALETFCKKTPVPLNSWDQLQEIAVSRFLHLFFSEDAFAPLKGHPFVHGAAHRLIALFQILNRFKACHDDQGKRTKEGHELYQNFFTGKKGGGGKGALFKDSSDGEKSDFKAEMTFTHPHRPGQQLFCPWHGSTQTPQLRIHFSWPVKSDEPVYIVYVGPKITKR